MYIYKYVTHMFTYTQIFTIIQTYNTELLTEVNLSFEV